MDDKKWEKLFDLICDVIAIKGVSADERGDLIMEKAKEFGGEGDLAEFLACVADKLD